MFSKGRSGLDVRFDTIFDLILPLPFHYEGGNEVVLPNLSSSRQHLVNTNTTLKCNFTH